MCSFLFSSIVSASIFSPTWQWVHNVCTDTTYAYNVHVHVIRGPYIHVHLNVHDLCMLTASTLTGKTYIVDTHKVVLSFTRGHHDIFQTRQTIINAHPPSLCMYKSPPKHVYIFPPVLTWVDLSNVGWHVLVCCARCVSSTANAATDGATIHRSSRCHIFGGSHVGKLHRQQYSPAQNSPEARFSNCTTNTYSRKYPTDWMID